jgi:nucleoside-diphosphate-sugar epimerase
MSSRRPPSQRKCAVVGTGQIGTYAIRALNEAGWSVIAADRDPAISFVQRFGRFDGPIATLDVTNADEVQAFLGAAGPIHAVLFTAGLTGQKAIEKPELAMRVAVQGVGNISRAMVAHGIPRLVAVSSLAVYDMPDRNCGKIAESAPTCGPTGAYGRIIRAMERELGKSDVLSVAILRMAGVFGPNRFGHGSHSSQLVERLLYCVAQGIQTTIRGDWRDCDDMIYVRDAGRAIAAAASLTNPGREIINVGTSKTTSLRDLVRAVEAVAGPADIVFEHRHDGSGPLARAPMDAHRMAQRLGAARYDLAAAIRDFAQETELVASLQGETHDG